MIACNLPQAANKVDRPQEPKTDQNPSKLPQQPDHHPLPLNNASILTTARYTYKSRTFLHQAKNRHKAAFPAAISRPGPDWLPGNPAPPSCIFTLPDSCFSIPVCRVSPKRPSHPIYSKAAHRSVHTSLNSQPTSTLTPHHLEEALEQRPPPTLPTNDTSTDLHQPSTFHIPHPKTSRKPHLQPAHCTPYRIPHPRRFFPRVPDADPGASHAGGLPQLYLSGCSLTHQISETMSERYSAEFLLHLRDSPLCVKPPNLPPAEEWMGYVLLLFFGSLLRAPLALAGSFLLSSVLSR